MAERAGRVSEVAPPAESGRTRLRYNSGSSLAARIMEPKLAKLSHVFAEFEAVKLVYCFGSRARGEAGPLSDYDFAVYLEEPDPVRATDIQLSLLGRLARELATDRVDVVVLNRIESPELKYHIICEGILLFEREPFKVLVEPRILTEYFDFRDSLRRHGLTRA